MAELVVFSTIGVRSAAEQLFAQFDKASHKLTVTWGTAPMLVKRIEGGETSDVLIPGIERCQKCHHEGKNAAESRCFECHTYHNWDKEKEVKGSFVLSRLGRGD